MRPIAAGEIMDLASYETIRPRFRARVIEDKKRRRVALGPSASAVFENRDTVLLQIQEMLRTERITRSDAVAHEIATYNELLPAADELSCTVMIEIADHEARDAFLTAAAGFEKHVSLTAGPHRLPARSIDRGADRSDRTTAVHYLKFALPSSLAAALRAASGDAGAVATVDLALEVDHPHYSARTALSPETIQEIARDLTD